MREYPTCEQSYTWVVTYMQAFLVNIDAPPLSLSIGDEEKI